MRSIFFCLFLSTSALAQVDSHSVGAKISLTTEDLDEYQDALKPYIWEYIDEIGKPGWYAGFMLQDVMHTKVGKSFVKGKSDPLRGVFLHYDIQRLVGIHSLLIKRNHERLKKCENGS